MGEAANRIVPPLAEPTLHTRPFKNGTSFVRCLAFLLEHEGIQSFDPDDPGGHTVFGVARKFWPKWEGWATVDAINAALPTQERRSVALAGNPALRGMVREFYYDNFWLKNSCEEMPFEVALPLFDFAMNSVAREARKALQRAVGATPDGEIGPNTLKLMNAKIKKTSAIGVGMKINDARLMRYVHRVQQGKSPAKYLGGWMRRIVAVVHEIHV